MIRLQIIPKPGFSLKSAIKTKERGLRGKGTFYRVDEGKWHHKKFDGWVWFEEGYGRVVCVVIDTKSAGGEWQIFEAFVGFLTRHFQGNIEGINIQF